MTSDSVASGGWEGFHDAALRGNEELVVEATAADAGTLVGRWLPKYRDGAAAVAGQAGLLHALTLAEPGSPLALRLRARLVAEIDFAAGESKGILAVVEESRHSPDPVARADVLSVAMQCLLGPDHGPVRQLLATELIRLSVRTGREADMMMGSLFRTSSMFLEGDVRSEQGLAELRALAATGEDDGVDLVVSAIDVMLAVRAGRLIDAEQLARDCAVRARLVGHPEADAWRAMHLIMLRWHQRRLPELIGMLEEITRLPTHASVDYFSYVSVLATARALAGDRRGARSALATLRHHGLASLPRTGNWLVTMSGVVAAGRLVGEVEACLEAYELLRPNAHRPVMVGLGVACFGSVHPTLGAACLAVGRVEQAVEHFRQGIRDNEALAHWPAFARARQQYARARQQSVRARSVRGCLRNVAAAAENDRLVSITPPGTRRPAAPAVDRPASKPLLRAEVARLAEGVFGASPDVDLLDHLLTAGGDRRMSRLLIAGLAEEKMIRIDAGTARWADGGPPNGSLPRRVRAEVRLILDGLTVRCRQLLCTAAVLGPRIAPERLARALGDRTAALLPAWEEAASSELVRADRDALVFVSELLRQAVAQSMPSAIRVALQREQAQLDGEAQVASPPPAVAARPATVVRPQPAAAAGGGPRAVPDTAAGPGVTGRSPGLLTAREQHVLPMVARGHSNQQIASTLGISSHAVKRHVSNLLIKLHCTNRTELALLVVRLEAEGQPPPD